MKKERHELILNLIESNNISTQEELLQNLLALGVNVTQATVSRDIKELRLVKQSFPNGEYRYTVASEGDEKMIKYRSIFSDSVYSIDLAGNICVIKCHVGTAQAACTAIDRFNIENIVGTLAGDDTIFVACKNEDAASSVKTTLDSYI